MSSLAATNNSVEGAPTKEPAENGTAETVATSEEEAVAFVTSPPQQQQPSTPTNNLGHFNGFNVSRVKKVKLEGPGGTYVVVAVIN